MDNNRHCPQCRWQIAPQDLFCGSCAYQLVCLKVTPDADKDLQGAPWTIYYGIPFALMIENEGVNPVEIRDLLTDGFEITQWHSTEPPYTLAPGETAELRCSHNTRGGDMGRLELLSSLSSIDPVDLFIQYEEAPKISLIANEREFGYDVEEPQRCAIDPAEGRISFTLVHDSPLMLQAVPHLSEGESHFAILGIDREFPCQLSPKDKFRFSLTRRQNFEEFCPVALHFSFDGLGESEVVFRFLMYYFKRPELKENFSRTFINENALVSGGKKKIDFTLEVDHIKGPAFRIEKVTSNQTWLCVKSKITEQEPIPINSRSEVNIREENTYFQIDLLLVQDTLPIVEQLTTVEATLDIEGSIVGGDETFHQSFRLPVQVRPPLPLDFPIAVDFGTTNSCIAYIDDQDRNTEKLLQFGHMKEIPTVFQCLAITKSDDLVEFRQDLGTDERQIALQENEIVIGFGDTPKAMRFDPENISSISWGFKRTLRSPDEPIIYNDRGTGSLILNGRTYSQGNRYIEIDPIEKVGLYIRFLLERFTEDTGYLPSEAVFTYPAVFNRQKEAFSRAIAWAIQEMELKPFLDISEPEAIAFDYASDIAEMLDSDRPIVYGVFDCGGGTTDISIVRLTPQSGGRPDVEVLASDGDNDLGGDLLSFRIAQYLYEEVVPETFRKQFPFPDTLDRALRSQDPIEQNNFSRLYGLAEKIKENSKITPDFVDALDDPERHQSEEKGVLDLIEDPNITVNWPRISLASSTNTMLNIEGTKSSLDGTQQRNVQPINIAAIHNAVRGDLEKGFGKLNQMQEYLFGKKQIDDVHLDYLILEGNSSRFSMLEKIAREKAKAKEIIFKPEKLKESVALGAIEYGASLKDPTRIRLKGVHKLNYPICRTAFTHFVPIFGRWTPLIPGAIISPENLSPIMETGRENGQISLFEVFEWDLNRRVTQGGNRIVANLAVPTEDAAFQNARFWIYCLELRCDEDGRASLWYNYCVGDEKDGSDFEFVWEKHRNCENFSYT